MIPRAYMALFEPSNHAIRIYLQYVGNAFEPKTDEPANVVHICRVESTPNRSAMVPGCRAPDALFWGSEEDLWIRTTAADD